MAINWATWGPIIAGAGATGATAYLQNRQSNKNRQAQQEENALDREERRGRTAADVALEESMADPYRQQLQQARALAALDIIARGRTSPTRISVPAGMESWVPKISGGFSYDMNPDVRAAAGVLQKDVASGRTAPTMTDPANYGKTAAMNLRNPTGAPGAGAGGGMASGAGGGTAVPRAGSAADTSTSLGDDDFMASIFDPAQGGYERRGGGTGGVGKGAMRGASMGSVAGPIGAGVGALIGGIVGSATKHAKSAPTDLRVEDARDAVSRAYQQYFGRAASPDEVDQVLQGQGWRPGSRWVGQAGLSAVLRTLASSPEAQQRRQAPALTPSYEGLFQ